MPQITCPKCGDIPLNNVTIYNKTLRKQTFDLSPILPTCNICSAEVDVVGCTQDVKILLLNGTCGAGKSSTAEELVKSHGYLAIDADCVRQVQKHKQGADYVWENNSPEMVAEIGIAIDALSAIGDKIVISTVIEPRDLQKYKHLFESKGVDYRMILLKPPYEVAVKRTQTRTCFGSVTPEEWVRHFYDRLVFDDVEIFDNSDLTVEQSTAAILKSQPQILRIRKR